ncbi:MAG: hypothetical protein LKK19_01530 [Bacteroidales bacterium]|jgi:heme/copper-type cytochrome/quinol oxidase subunit 4|nr:hypothetical protein [Bacteroidales bacterium]MCI2121368.1 hypothetical protein [Bacteroidales bacterium]MCI2145513.1 hypothetical protein [Bacteroidales bacterium]
MKGTSLKCVFGAAIVVVSVALALVVPMSPAWKSMLAVLGVTAGGYLFFAPPSWLFSFRKLSEERSTRLALDICLSIIALAALAVVLYVIFFSELMPKMKIRIALGILIFSIVVLAFVARFERKSR